MSKERTMTNECYSCTGRRSIPGDCHIQCATPDPSMLGNTHGIRSGWFMYPWNFDPTWKITKCNNYVETK